jgi:putative DNA methylase
LAVVAAHPVHAELRAASPKTAAKDPISLDAILVCKKRNSACAPQLDQRAIVNRSTVLTSRLLDAGMSISSADRFVIVASQTLVALSNADVNFEVACNTIVQANKAAQQGAPGGAPKAERP